MSADSAAAGGLTTRFTIDDADPESSVPNPQEAMRSPLEMGYHVMLLSEKAEASTKRGDHAAAARYWRAMAKAVPDQSMPHVRLCSSYEAAGEPAKALESCRDALGRRGVTLADNQRYVKLLLDKPGSLGPRDIGDLDAIGAHLEKGLGAEGPLVANRLRCQLGARVGDLERLDACTAKLQALAPGDPQSLVYSWTLALKRGDLERAEHWIERARAAGLPADAVERMSQTLREERDRREPRWRRALRASVRPALGFALLLLVVATIWTNRRRQRPKQV